MGKKNREMKRERKRCEVGRRKSTSIIRQFKALWRSQLEVSLQHQQRDAPQKVDPEVKTFA